MPSSIMDRIRSADNLPSLPTVAIQIIQMTQTEDASIADIARVIQQDPALTLKILKLVNSSLFGMSRRISSVQQALVVLGLRTVKVMVLSFSLVETLKNRRHGEFDYAGYWRRSLTTAVAGKLLGEKLRKNIAEEAFVGGLLCDVGMLAAYHCAGDLYQPVLQALEVQRRPIQEIEQQLLGVSHEVIGASLLDHWGLPESLCHSISTHHQPIGQAGPSAGADDLVRLIRAAALIGELFCSEVQAARLEELKRQCVNDLPTEEPVLNNVLEALDTHVAETASLFSLKIGPTRSYHDIQAEAVVQLARLSMAAELERAQIAQREKAARQEVEQLNTLNRELVQQATTDGLTGIGNRSAFEDHLSAACRESASRGVPMGLLFMDLDRFKKLNDTFGHQVGDEALRQVGGVLRKLRSNERFPARYGGEEFALVVTNCTGQQLRELAEELRISVQQLSIPFGQKRISITVSVGAAFAEPDDPGLTPKSLTRRADECLYEAKYNGRNRVAYAALRLGEPRPKVHA